MKKEIKVKISNMTYDSDNNLFQLYIKDLEGGNEAIFGIKGTDWGITSDVPIEIISQFCKDMIGREKNLCVEVDNTSILGTERDENGKILTSEMDKLHQNLNNYPINEIMNNIHFGSEGSEDEN